MKNQEFYPDGSSNLVASARWKNLFRAVPLLLIAGIYLFFAQWGTWGIVVGAIISIVLLFFAIILVLDPDLSKKENKSVPYLSIPLFISIFLLIMVFVPRNHSYGLSYDRLEDVYYEESIAAEEVVEQPAQIAESQTSNNTKKIAIEEVVVEKPAPVAEPQTSANKEQPVVSRQTNTVTDTKFIDKEKQEKEALATAEKLFKDSKFDEALQNYKLAGEAGKQAGYSTFKNKAIELINLLDECDSNAKALLLKAQQLNDTQEIRNLLNNCK